MNRMENQSRYKEISLLKKKKQAVVTLLKYKPVFDELKTLSGRKKFKFEKEQQAEISAHNQTLNQMKEFFRMDVFQLLILCKKRNALIYKRSEKNKEYSVLQEFIIIHIIL